MKHKWILYHGIAFHHLECACGEGMWPTKTKASMRDDYPYKIIESEDRATADLLAKIVKC